MNATSGLIEAAKYYSDAGVLFVKCWGLMLVTLGSVGHSLSIYVFTRPTLRANPCCMYFLASTLSGLLVTYISQPIRVLQIGYNSIDPAVRSLPFCKIAWFLLYTPRSLSPWFLALACIDRFCCSSSSVNVRAWSNTRTALRVIGITVVLMCLGYSHLFFYATIEYVAVTEQYSCNSQSGTYRTFFALWNLIVFSLSPPVLMFIFGLLTLQHIRQSKHTRRRSVNSNQASSMLTTNRHTMRMLFVQCLVIMITSAPFSIGWLYVSLTNNQQKDILQLAKESLLTNVIGFLSVTGSSIGFYLFTLSSSLFRKELSRLFCKRCGRRVIPANR